MGYDVYILKHPYQPMTDEEYENASWDEAVEHFRRQKVHLAQKHYITGGMFAVGGTDDPWLHVTFNYAEAFCKFLGGDGINDFHDRPVRETLPKLIEAVSNMHGEPDDDYWKPTEGNARAALMNMIQLACLSPETLNGYWFIDK